LLTLSKRQRKSSYPEDHSAQSEFHFDLQNSRCPQYERRPYIYSVAVALFCPALDKRCCAQRSGPYFHFRSFEHLPVIATRADAMTARAQKPVK